MLVEVPDSYIAFLFQHGKVEQQKSGLAPILFVPSVNWSEDEVTTPVKSKNEMVTPKSKVSSVFTPPSEETKHKNSKFSYADVIRKSSVDVSDKDTDVEKDDEKNEEKDRDVETIHSSLSEKEYQKHLCNHCGQNLKTPSVCNSFCHFLNCTRREKCHYIHLNKNHIGKYASVRFFENPKRYYECFCIIEEIYFFKNQRPGTVIIQFLDGDLAKQIPKELVSYDPDNDLFASVKPDQLVNFWGSENPSEESEDEENQDEDSK